MKIRYKDSIDFLLALKMYYGDHSREINEEEATSVEYVISDKVFFKFEGNEAKPDKDLSKYTFYFVTSRSLGWILEYSSKFEEVSDLLVKEIEKIGFSVIGGEIS